MLPSGVPLLLLQLLQSLAAASDSSILRPRPPHQRAAAASSRNDATTPVLVDSLGLPLTAMGFYSAEPVSSTATNIRELKLGPNTVMPILGDLETWKPMGDLTGDCSAGVCGWELIEDWLTRCDQVGASVFWPLDRQYLTLLKNQTGCPGGVGPGCLDVVSAIMARVKAHRSVVSWYIADEPDGGSANVTLTTLHAAVLGSLYRHVKSIDARPVSICVDSTPPDLKANEHNFPAFLPFTDIVLADIYPVSHHWTNGLTVAGGIELLRNHTTKPIMLVAQSFGGTECYPREPTPTEERLMVYLAWIHGASGVLFFDHEDPLVMTMDGGAETHQKNPGSANLWMECQRLAIEATELTTALSSDRSKAPAVTSGNSSIYSTVLVDRTGSLVVLVASAVNEPMPVTLTVSGLHGQTIAAVMFSHRNVTITAAGEIKDWVDALGTRVYRIRPVQDTGGKILPSASNVILNPSFEESGGQYNTAGGNAFPDGYWLLVGNDTMATVVPETRDSVHGLTSLRLHTPVDHTGMMAVAYPPEAATMHPGLNWTLSVWAKSLSTESKSAPLFRFGCPYYYYYSWFTPENFGKIEPSRAPCVEPHCFVSNVSLGSTWQRYELNVSSPDRVFSGDTSWVFVELVGAGTALVDLLELVPLHGPLKTDDVLSA